MANRPNKIIWHHTADALMSHQFEKINKYHKSRGFPLSSLGFYVGYHWLIEHDGTLKQARKENEIGAHDKGENVGSIGIALAGNFNHTRPTGAQKKTAAILVKRILKDWNIHITRIEPHRKNDATDCPGRRLRDNWLPIVYIHREINLLTRLLQRLRLRLR